MFLDSVIRDYREIRGNLYNQIDSLMTGDNGIDRYLLNHKNFLVVFAGFFGKYFYQFSNVNSNRHKNKSILSTAYSTILFNNIDEIIDNGLIEIQDRLNIVDRYKNILLENENKLTTEDYSIDPKKIEELDLISNEILKLFDNNTSRELYIKTFENLANVVKSQIVGDFSQRDYEDPVEINLKIKNLENRISEIGLDQETSQRLILASRMGIYTTGVMSFYPFTIKGVEQDFSLLDSIIFYGAYGQIKDDLIDRKGDIKKGQKTFATQDISNTNLKKISDFSKELKENAFFNISSEKRKSLKNIDIFYNIAAYFSSEFIRDLFQSRRDLALLVKK